MIASNRVFASSLFVLATTLAACSGNSDTTATETDASADSAVSCGASMTPLAKDQDLSCATDADCTLVPPGGNPCACPGEVILCKTAPISVGASAMYSETVHNYRLKYGPGLTCTTPASCPAESLQTPPKCCAGTCTLAADCHS